MHQSLYFDCVSFPAASALATQHIKYLIFRHPLELLDKTPLSYETRGSYSLFMASPLEKALRLVVDLLTMPYLNMIPFCSEFAEKSRFKFY